MEASKNIENCFRTFQFFDNFYLWMWISKELKLSFDDNDMDKSFNI